MKGKIIYLAFVLIILTISGCKNLHFVTSSVITGNKYPEVTADVIKVILFGDIPEIEEIGMIQIVVTSEYYDRIDKVVERAKEEAHKMGANVIILNRQGVVARKSTESVSPDPANLSQSYSVPVTVETPKYVFWAGRLK